jgi:hypothetical protein
MGLRVSARASSGWWPRIGLRTAVFHTPQLIHTLVMLAATGGLPAPSVRYTANAAPSGWYWNLPPYALVSLLSTVLLWLLTLLLFSTARRGNGWRGVHELLSRTRVVQRTVRPVTSAAPKASPADPGPALSSLRRVGPYAVHTTVGETGAGRLSVGIDPILRRHVWIHEVPPGTPPVENARRDTSRPGRLYWLAGRRSATENWDAFEAPRGQPLLSAPSPAGWPEVHRSLTSLAIELDASVRQGMDLRPVLAQVWKKADGHLVLLDFPWPGLTGSDADEHLSPVALLAAVSARALAATAEPMAPLSGTKLLTQLASGAPPPLADVKTELVRLASTPDRPLRVRRAVPIVMAAMPVAALVLIVSVFIPMFARSLQGNVGNMLRQRNDFIRWMTWLTATGADAEFKTREQREAAEQYVAARFGSQLTSDFWNTQAPQIEPFLTMRRTAAEIAARYPSVAPDELARASAIVAPQIRELAAESANLGANVPAGGAALRGFIASGFASIPVLVSIVFGLASVLVVPGGLVTSALRHAVVRRDGREIGRARSAIRLLVGWSPALVWIGCVGVPMFGEPRVSPDMAFVTGSLVFLLMAAGVAWTIASPGRGPHDHIAGTWVVPR